jgi:TM2 domain-containing membrane protein YozV
MSWRGKTFILVLILSIGSAKWAVTQNIQEADTVFFPLLEKDVSLSDQPIPEGRSQRNRSQDTVIVVTNNAPDPIKAALLSAALPGLGQIYNKSYWKVPIVYGSLMTFGYLVHFFDYNYIKYRNAFLAENDGNPNTINPYEGDRRISSRLFDRVEFYRRNRDYMMILTAGFYLLNIVEAHVDAHLQTFDLSDDISMNIRPGIITTPYTNQIGLSINFTLK